MDVERPRLRVGERPKPSEFTAFASYHLPSAWLALYSADDLRCIAMDADLDDYLEPFFISRTTVALARLRSRIAVIAAMFSNEIVPAVEDFIEAITEANQAYIVLDATDVATDEPGIWVEQLRAIVAGFDQVNSPGWERYFRAFPRPSGKLIDAEFIVGTGF
jgi:hypothetical protein